MCGIVGFFRTGAPGGRDAELLATMNGTIRHRGPDGEGAWLGGPVGLAMRRLAIIDLAGGAQPVTNEDGRIRLVFNGEIYNYRELRAGLSQHRFASASDTEVIAHLYEEHGPAAFGMLNGMFAIALWDERERELYVVRDRLGIKPLYHVEHDGRWLFASELKALLAVPGLSPRLDPGALEAYLTWQYVPGPATMVEGVSKLGPGHYVRWREGEAPEFVRYWAPEAALAGRPSDPGRALDVLRQAVRRQMVSDVPVGAFLSGGLDSSVVVALMREVAGDQLETFTAGFADPRLDEAPWAQAVAQALGVAHHVVRLDESSLETLPALARHLDEPIGDRAALPTLLLSRFARERVKVVLTGEGSDELLAGYPRYRLEGLARAFHRLPFSQRREVWAAAARLAPMALRGRLEKLLLSPADPAARREAWVCNFTPAARAHLLGRPAATLAPAPAADDLASQLLLDLRTWLVDDVLMKVDKTTMAASLEARVPFLDFEVVDWALALPDGAKLRGGTGKAVLRDAAARLLPAAVRRRPKQAFHTPTALWFRTPRGESLLTDVLLGGRALERGLFARAEVERLVAEHRAGTDRDQALWSLLMLELWQQAYLDRQPVEA